MQTVGKFLMQFNTLWTFVGARAVRGLVEVPNVHPVVGPALEFGAQQAIPMALDGEVK